MSGVFVAPTTCACFVQLSSATSMAFLFLQGEKSRASPAAELPAHLCSAAVP